MGDTGKPPPPLPPGWHEAAYSASGELQVDSLTVPTAVPTAASASAAPLAIAPQSMRLMRAVASEEASSTVDLSAEGLEQNPYLAKAETEAPSAEPLSDVATAEPAAPTSALLA